jgi:hypothetical protein
VLMAESLVTTKAFHRNSVRPSSSLAQKVSVAYHKTGNRA